jgi:hypothetical protein
MGVLGERYKVDVAESKSVHRVVGVAPVRFIVFNSIGNSFHLSPSVVTKTYSSGYPSSMKTSAT